MAAKPFVYLSDIPIFRALREDDEERLGRNAVRKRFRRGVVLQIEGQPAEYFAVVTRGTAKAVLLRPDGGEILLHFYEPGEFFGEANVLGNETSPHSIVVLKNAEFLFLESALIADLVRENGKFAFDLLRRQSERLATLQQRFRDALYERGDGRILKYLEGLAAQSGVETAEGLLIPDKVSHQIIADTCGLARETVTRLLGDLRDKGKLRQSKEGWLLPK